MGSSSSKRDNSWANPPKGKVIKGIKKATPEQQEQLRKLKGMTRAIVSGKPIRLLPEDGNFKLLKK